jgi:hypothetical protein
MKPKALATDSAGVKFGWDTRNLDEWSMNTEVFAQSWAAVLTVSEPRELVLANVAHHLSLGAQEVFIFLDTEDADLEVRLRSHPKCIVRNCDAAYWLEFHARKIAPSHHTRRQTLNADLAAQETTSGWLLMIDADEFLWCTAEFGQILAEAPQEAGWLKTMPWERRFVEGQPQKDILDGQFLAFNNEVMRSALTQGGFTGHVAGKPCARMGQGYKMSIHNPRIGRIVDGNVPLKEDDERAFLLHFDGLTPLHFASKLLRRAQRGPNYVINNYRGKRRRQIALAAKTVASLAGLARLQGDIAGPLEDGDLRAVDMRIAESLVTQFPSAFVDLSAAQFDQALAPDLADMRATVESWGDVWDLPN